MSPSKDFRTIDDLSDEAYALVEQGMCYDEVGDREGALRMYEQGLALVEEAGKMPNAGSNVAYRKMTVAREHIDNRLNDLRSGGGSGKAEPSAPPYEDIKGAIEAFGAEDVDEIFLIPFGVHLFMIEGDDMSVPTYPEDLKIFKFHPDKKRGPDEANAFIQVGGWVYPLIAGRSPVLHSDFGAYVFPNPTDEKPNLYVGVLLPQDLDQDTVNGFRNILKELTELREQTGTTELSREEQTALSEKIAGFLIKTGEYIAWGLKEGADRTSNLVSHHSTKYRNSVARTKQPLVIDRRVQTSIHFLRWGAKVAVKVSGYLLNKIGEIGVLLGKQLASRVQKRVGAASTSAGSLVSGAFDVIGGGIVGASTVWMGLENAAKSLGKNIANETVLVVDHKYGEQAASTANNAMYATGHTAMTALHVVDFGFKGIAKRTASKAGVQMFKDLSETVKQSRTGAEASGTSRL